MVFGAIVLLMVGMFQILEALAALAKDDIYVNTADYLYQFNITTWGWIHLIMGVIAVLAAAGILADKDWAKGLGILIAVLSAASNFLFLPYYPLWTLIVIALNVAVIWALATTFGRHSGWE